MGRLVELIDLLLQHETEMFDKLMGQADNPNLLIGLIVFLIVRFSKILLLAIALEFALRFGIL